MSHLGWVHHKQDLVFGCSITNSLRQVIAAHGYSPEGIMTNAEIQARWAEIINIIGDELTTNKVSTLCSTVDVSEDNAMQVDIDRTSMIEYTHIDQCAHDTADYWNSFAAQTVRQYVKLTPEANRNSGIASDVTDSALNGGYVGELNMSTIAICLDPDLLQESSHHPVDRKPPPSQEILNKLLQGVLCARGGASNAAGLCVAPRDNDILFLCDGGRDVTKAALHVP